MNKNPVLELRDICASYDGKTDVLTDVCVSIYPAETIALLGNNGAGKSTFFLCANGVLPCRSGSIRLYGKTLGRSKDDLTQLRKAVGLVFQEADTQIIASTVEAEISFGPMNLELSAAETSERVDEALAFTGLEAYRKRPPHYLSGGEKKRVTIADIIAMRPAVCCFDEPTSSLDPRNRELFEDTLAKLRARNISAVVSTHDADFAWRWADRVLVFSNGRLAADAPPRVVFADSALLETAGLAKPLLFELAEKARARHETLRSKPMPRSADEFVSLGYLAV